MLFLGAISTICIQVCDPRQKWPSVNEVLAAFSFYSLQLPFFCALLGFIFIAATFPVLCA